MGPVVEEDAHRVVGELVPEAVLVGVIDPLGDPLEGGAQLLPGNAVGFRHVLQAPAEDSGHRVRHTPHGAVLQAWAVEKVTE